MPSLGCHVSNVDVPLEVFREMYIKISSSSHSSQNSPVEVGYHASSCLFGGLHTCQVRKTYLSPFPILPIFEGLPGVLRNLQESTRTYSAIEAHLNNK